MEFPCNFESVRNFIVMLTDINFVDITPDHIFKYYISLLLVSCSDNSKYTATERFIPISLKTKASPRNKSNYRTKKVSNYHLIPETEMWS